MADAPSPPGREARIARLWAELERQARERDWQVCRPATEWRDGLAVPVAGRLHLDMLADLGALADAAAGPDDHPAGIEVRLNDDGTLDEVVAVNATVHLEQMSGTSWYLGIYKGALAQQVWLGSSRKVTATTERS